MRQGDQIWGCCNKPGERSQQPGPGWCWRLESAHTPDPLRRQSWQDLLMDWTWEMREMMSPSLQPKWEERSCCCLKWERLQHNPDYWGARVESCCVWFWTELTYDRYRVSTGLHYLLYEIYSSFSLQAPDLKALPISLAILSTSLAPSPLNEYQVSKQWHPKVSQIQPSNVF